MLCAKGEVEGFGGLEFSAQLEDGFGRGSRGGGGEGEVLCEKETMPVSDSVTFVRFESLSPRMLAPTKHKT